MTDDNVTNPEDSWEREYESAMLAAVQALDPRWGVRGYRALRMSGGVAYTFTLLDAGKPVATVEDNGNGGGAWPRWHDGIRSAAAVAWETEAATLGDTMASELLIEALLRRAGK